MRDDILIQGTLSIEDFIKYNIYHSRKMLRRYFIYCFLILLSISFILELSRNINFSLSEFRLLAVYISYAVLSLIFSFLIIYSLKKIIERRVAKEFDSDQVIKNHVSYIINDGGSTQIIRESKNYYNLSDIFMALEHKEMFLLYLSKQKAIVLPKRFFSSKSEIDIFKTKVLANMEIDKENLT